MNNEQMGKLIESLQAEIKELRAANTALSKQFESYKSATPMTKLAAAISAREARRQAKSEQAAEEVAGSKLVPCRVHRQVTRRVNGKTVVEDLSRPIVISSTWRGRGIWPDAPVELLPYDEHGSAMVYEIPERVFKSLQPEVVSVTSEEFRQLKAEAAARARREEERALDRKVRKE